MGNLHSTNTGGIVRLSRQGTIRGLEFSTGSLLSLEGARDVTNHSHHFRLCLNDSC